MPQFTQLPFKSLAVLAWAGIKLGIGFWWFRATAELGTFDLLWALIAVAVLVAGFYSFRRWRQNHSSRRDVRHLSPAWIRQLPLVDECA